MIRPLRVALLALLAGAAPPAAPPHRVVSLDLCADELVVALADPGQIAALTEWARDPDLSTVAERARAVPITHRSAEEILAARPDLVIGAPYRTRALLAPLAARGVTLLAMPQADDPAGAEAAIRTIAGALGHPARGAALIARMRGELARVGPPPGRGRTAAYYQRQGYLTGGGTLVDAMMHRLGLVDLATRLGRPALSRIALEQLVLARPDFVVTEENVAGARDPGTAMLRHPLLARAIPPTHRLFVPQALTVCAGPAYPHAVAMLAAQIRRADAMPGPATQPR